MQEFKNLIVLGPLIYALHHFEEHIIFNFRAWRLNYFSDNNPISTEEILIRLSAFLLIIIFLHLIKNNRASAHLVLFFLMTTQVINAFLHIFFSFYFYDFSPGTITALLLYLPVNYLIFNAALREGYIGSKKEIIYFFIMGACTFALFEIIGPVVLAISMILSVFYYLIFNKYYDNRAA